MRRRRLHLAAVAATALVLAASGCASSRPTVPDSLSVQLYGPGGEGFTVQVTSDLVREAVETALGAELQCDATLDPALASLLGNLERQGPRGRAAVRRERDVLEGSRHGRSLELVIRDEDGGRIEVRMPWAVGACLLGRAPDLTTALAQGGGDPVLEVWIGGENRASFRASLE